MASVGAVVVRVAIVCGPVAHAVVGRARSVLADHVLRSAEAHEAADQLGMYAPDGAHGHARVASDVGGGSGWVWDGCCLLHVHAVPCPMCSSKESCFDSLAIARKARSFRMLSPEAEDRP